MRPEGVRVLPGPHPLAGEIAPEILPVIHLQIQG